MYQVCRFTASMLTPFSGERQLVCKANLGENSRTYVLVGGQGEKERLYLVKRKGDPVQISTRSSFYPVEVVQEMPERPTLFFRWNRKSKKFDFRAEATMVIGELTITIVIENNYEAVRGARIRHGSWWRVEPVRIVAQNGNRALLIANPVEYVVPRLARRSQQVLSA